MRIRTAFILIMALCMLPFLVAMYWYTGLGINTLAKKHATTAIGRLEKQVGTKLKNDLQKMKQLLHVAATTASGRDRFYRTDASFKLLKDLLSFTPHAVSAYVGTEDGSFRQVRHIDVNAPIHGVLPPENTKYAYRWVTTDRKTRKRTDRYVFYDANDKIVGKARKSTRYDPRQRLWYREGRSASAPATTPVTGFAALGLVGFSIVAPIIEKAKTQGVLAIDITLQGLDEFLAKNKISPNANTLILNRNNEIIASVGPLATPSKLSDGNVLDSIFQFERLLPSYVRARSSKSETALIQDHSQTVLRHLTPLSEGLTLASLRSLKAATGQTWSLYTAAPLDDFNAEYLSFLSWYQKVALAAMLVLIISAFVLARTLSMPLERLAKRLETIRNLEFGEAPSVASWTKEVKTLDRAVSALNTSAHALSLLAPRSVTQDLIETRSTIKKSASNKLLTIMFCDMQNFSTLAERVPTANLLEETTQYFNIVSKEVDGTSGTVAQFIGDAAMAFWGAPRKTDNDALNSCITAVRVQHRIAQRNLEHRRSDDDALKVRIGIHTDSAIVGHIGSDDRLNYCAIGDGVNVAARLEGLNKKFGTSICISHNTYRDAGDRLIVRPLDRVAVKGRLSEIVVYELLGVAGEAASSSKLKQIREVSALSRIAFQFYLQSDYAAAIAKYSELLRLHAGDGHSRTMLDKCRELLEDCSEADDAIAPSQDDNDYSKRMLRLAAEA